MTHRTPREDVEIMADRLPAQSSQNPQDAHEDLLATIAASRELGPEMDKALAERYLEKHSKPAVAPQPKQQQPPVAAYSPNQALAAIGPMLCIAAFITILIGSGGHLWWLFWLPLVFGGWWGRWWWGGPHYGGYNSRDDWRQARRDARYQYRAWRHGYSPYPYPPRSDDGSQPPASSQDPRQNNEVL